MDTLILVPTELERVRLARSLDAELELCGFGPIAAAARGAELLARHRPTRVLLVGIAGSFDTDLVAIGAASTFERVHGDGVGVASEGRFLGPRELGLPQLPALEGDAAVHDTVDLHAPEGTARGTLLTAPTASSDPVEARARRERVPDATAEDMEAFGVALACHRARTPLCVVRGISNAVGDRDHARWRIDEALAAAATLAAHALDAAWVPTQDGAR